MSMINLGDNEPAKEFQQQKGLNIRVYQFLFISVFVTGMIYLSFQNYLLFHNIIELFSIIIAYIIFVIAINTTKFTGSHYGNLIFLGISFGIIGAFDLLHTLAYKGMGVFPGSTTNLATELWVVARYLESIALFLYCIFLDKKNLETRAVLFIYILVSVVLFASVFIFDIFPDCFTEGYGLTDFKIISEIVVSSILFAGIIILFIRMKPQKDRTVKLIMLSLVLTILSEVTFIFYIDVFGISNMIGHIFKVISFYLIYKAIVEVNLTSPFIKLRQSEKKYSDLCECLPESVLICTDKRIAFANKAAKLLLGKDNIEKNTADIFSDAPETLENHHGLVIEKRLIRPDGTAVSVEVKYLPYNHMGEQAVMAVLYDVSDRKRAEEEARRVADLQLEAEILRKKEQEYLEILDGSTEASWIYDFEDSTLKYSFEWKKRIGGEDVSDEEMNLYAKSLLHPDDVNNVMRDRKEIYESKRTKYKSEYRFKINTGEYIWVYDQGKIVYDEKGVPVKIYGTSMDISERKKAEEALRASESNALALIEELKQTDKNKNEFLSTLSHELRNPLASIVLGLSIMEMSDKEEQKKKAAETVKRQVDQMCHLVDDLLHLTRITQNRIELQREILEFSSLAESMVQDFKAAFEEKGIALKKDISSKDINIEADSVRVRQAIGNLLYNALKFTNTGGEVILSVFRQENRAVVSVKDNGIGIRTEFLPKVFEPFSQADESLDRTSGGLGLGLSIVKGIAELHGGSTGAYSEGPGKGSEFTISFPAC
jgi:PAS domain S-box-containing protein